MPAIEGGRRRETSARAHMNFDTNRIRAGFCNRFLVSYEFIPCTLALARVHEYGHSMFVLTSHLLCNSNIYFVFSNFVSNLCFGGMRSRSMRIYSAAAEFDVRATPTEPLLECVPNGFALIRCASNALSRDIPRRSKEK